ncbi:MAG: ABC transporter permease [Desulfobaccales bacterium]|nr:ABC transporter permease [Desulfobaccales bacterium]
MNFGRTWAIFRKELIHIRRDIRSLIQIILLPIMLMMLYGYALTFDIKHVPTAIYDQEQSRVSAEFIRRFQGSEYFKVSRFLSSYGEIDHLLTTRQVQLVLVLPFDFSRPLKKKGTTKVQVLVDGTDANTANIILGYVQAVIGVYNQNVVTERLDRQGLGYVKVPVTTESRFWFNEDLESVNYIVPGLIAVIMTMVGALLTALTVVREVERGSMESLMSTPLKKAELLLGKMAPYFVIGMVDMLITIAMGQFLFGVPQRGSFLLLIGLSALFLIATLAHGLLISVTSENQLQAYQMAMLTTFLPAFLISGFVFSIYLMPWPLQAMSFLVPARYLVTITKGIYLKGLGLKVLWPDMLMLMGASVLFMSLALKKFVKKIR